MIVSHLEDVIVIIVVVWLVLLPRSLLRSSLSDAVLDDVRPEVSLEVGQLCGRDDPIVPGLLVDVLRDENH